MDKIEQMRAFAAVVANGSFSVAAHRLGATPQLVSKYVKGLEDDMRVRLLNRTTRSVQPTDTGRAFYARATRVIEDFDDLLASARDEHAAPRGALKITAPTTFGELFLTPVIADFLDAYPETSVDLHLTDRFVGLIDEGFDLAIRIGALDSSGLIARRLTETPIRLCASPGYLAAHGAPAHPRELASHRCLIDTNFRNPNQWRFTIDGAPVAVRVTARFRVNSATAVRRLLLADAGLALCPSYVVRDDLRSGALVSVLHGAVADTLGVYAVYLESRHLSGKIRAFVDFIAERVRDAD
ncbi:MAG: LysR family transcriptional regulator [Pseudomonadota bacterium]